MTIPGTYKRNTTGGAFTAGKVGGTAIGVTSTTNTANGQPMTKTFTVRDNAIEGQTERRNVVIQQTGVNTSAYNATTALSSGGTFAYDQVAFMIRTHTTTINGSANNALLFAASSMRRKAKSTREKQFGAKVLTAWRNKGWVEIGIAGQRSNWDASVASVGTGGVLSILSDTYKSTTDNTSDSSDDAPNNHTAAVPAEISFAFGGTTIKDTQYRDRTTV